MSADRFANLRGAAWRDALRVLAIQALAAAVVFLAATVGWNARVGFGALIGAGIGLLANAYLALALLGKPLLTGKPSSILLSWLVRAGLTAGLLLIVLRMKRVPPISLITGLVAIYAAHWWAVSFGIRGSR